MICISSKTMKQGVSSESIEWLFEGARRLNVNVDQAILACGLGFTAEEFRAGKVRSLSAPAYCNLYYQLNYLIQNTALEKHGRRGFMPEHFKLMCNSIITAEDLGEAIDRLCTFFDLAHERFGGAFALSTDGDEVRFSMDVGWGTDTNSAEQEIEKKSLFLFYYLYSWLIGRPIALDSVSFRLPHIADHSKWNNKFRAQVLAGQAYNGFVFPRSYLALPNIQNYSRLKTFLEEYPFLLLLPVTAIGDAVCDYVEQTMMTLCLKEARFPSFSRLALLCGYSESSLGRKLRAEGKSFSELKVRCQLGMAKTYMWRAELSIADIAALLGFSSANSFSRSFKAWTGLPPAEFRRKLTDPES